MSTPPTKDLTPSPRSPRRCRVDPGSTGAWPQAITIDTAGNVYTANWNARSVSKITPSGRSKIIGRTGRRPIGITTDLNGNIYTTNDGANSVSKIVPGGKSKVIARTGRRPIGIASDAAGFLYTANFLSNSVTEVYPAARHHRNVLTLDTVTVRAPRNRNAGSSPSGTTSTRTRRPAKPPSQRCGRPSTRTPTRPSSGVRDNLHGDRAGALPYRIAETELTVGQWVKFLNTVDPGGKNRHRLWDFSQSSRVWPVRFREPQQARPTRPALLRRVPSGEDKPYNVADFTRAARLANSLDNGRLLSPALVG